MVSSLIPRNVINNCAILLMLFLFSLFKCLVWKRRRMLSNNEDCLSLNGPCDVWLTGSLISYLREWCSVRRLREHYRRSLNILPIFHCIKESSNLFYVTNKNVINIQRAFHSVINKTFLPGNILTHSRKNTSVTNKMTVFCCGFPSSQHA